MQRIVIVGSTGSGKSTLAGEVARRLSARHIELDALHWEANWTPAPKEVFRARVAAALDGDGWIVDGNYGAVRDLIWPRADTLLWLDYPLWLNAWRLTWRIFSRGLRRTELWNGNREPIWEHFLPWERSLYVWLLRSHGRRRREYPAILARPEHAHLVVHRFGHPSEAERWLRALASDRQPAR